MNRTIFLIFLFSFSLFADDLYSNVKQKLAVIDFENINVNKSDARALSKRLTTEIVKIDKYIMVERSAMEKILEEQQFQTASGNVADDIVDIGNMVGADFIIFGSVSKVGSTFSIDSRIISTKTSEVVRSATYDASKLDKLVKKGMKSIAYQLCDIDFPVKNRANHLQKEKRGNIEKINPTESNYTNSIKTNNKQESWYLYASYGFYQPAYWNERAEYIDLLNDFDELETNKIYFELGCYWHITPTSLGGLNLESSTISRDIKINNSYNDWLKANENDSQALISLSFISYMNKFGEGLFLKGGIGSAASVNTSYLAGSDIDGIYDYTETYQGWGYNFEVGYSLNFGGTRAIASIGYGGMILDFKSIEYSDGETYELNDYSSDTQDELTNLKYSKTFAKIGFIF